jgi:predicted permease
VVLPVFILMAIGFFCRMIKVIPEVGFNHLNKLCFNLFLPVLIFKNIAFSNGAGGYSWRLPVFVCAAQIVNMALCLLLVPLFEKDHARAGSCAQGMFRVNFVALGIPMISHVLSPDGIAQVSILAASVVPIYNVCSVLILERFREHSGSAWKSAVKNVVTNPLIISCILGLVFMFLPWKLPAMITGVLSEIANATSPVAIITLGGLLNLPNMRDRLKSVMLATIGKLLFLPALVLAAAALLGFRGDSFLAIAAVFMTPTAVASFAMAKQMDADGDCASMLIVSTSVGSIATMAFWLALSHALGLW